MSDISSGWSVVLDLERLRALEGEPLEMELELPPFSFQYWGQSYELEGPAKVSLFASLSEGELIVWGQMRATLRTACGRCLGPALFEVDEPFTFVYREGLPVELEEEHQIAEGEENEVLVGSLVGKLDVAHQLEEVLILGIPPKVVCSELCRGICPSCGKNLNEGDCSCSLEAGDPRLSALKELLEGGGDAHGRAEEEDEQS